MVKKFTPGPWKAETTPDGMNSKIKAQHKGEAVMIAMADGHLNNDRENFKMMAQAPCLLEACEDAFDCLIETPKDKPQVEAARDILANAIFHATGANPSEQTET